MHVGVNLTSPISSEVPLALLRGGHANFCELLIDNFLHLAPETVREAVGDVPLGFHIMNSRFLEQEPDILTPMATRLRYLIEELEPLYVSDHLGHFSHQGRRLPMVLELDYEAEYAATAERVKRWQDLLGQRLYVENFPSLFPAGRGQAAFYARLLAETGAGLLFDLSNAVVAERNGGLAASAWLPLAAATTHFHVAGYTYENASPPVTLDTHDTNVSEESLAFVALAGRTAATVTVERDANITEASWLEDLQAVRRVLA
jgi:uncharacterized protein (UPF0276 family)